MDTETAALLLLAATWLPERSALRLIVERIGLDELTPREGLVLLNRHGIPPAPPELTGDGPATRAVARITRQCADCLKSIRLTSIRCRHCHMVHRHAVEGLKRKGPEGVTPSTFTIE